MPTYQLVPFDIYEARTIATWLLDADDVFRFTGERHYPVHPGEIVVWAQHASSAHIFLVDAEATAYAEIVEDDVDGDIEINRIILAPSRRDDDTARALISHLADLVRDEYTYTELWLRVGREFDRDLQNGLVNGFVEAPECSGPRFIWLKKQL